MKIAINASILDDKTDGVRVYTISIINSLIKLPEAKKHEITIFTPIAKYFKESKNVKIIKIPSLMMNSRHRKIAPSFRFLWNSLIYTRLGRKFDISYSTTPNGSLFLKNQIVTLHDLTAFHYPKIYKIRTNYFKFILPIILKNSKVILTVSDFLKKEISKEFNSPMENIKIIPCAYNKNIFKINKKIKRKKIILIVGATYRYKNIEKVLKAYILLPEEIKKKYKIFIIGGKKDYFKIINKIINKNNLNKNVKIFYSMNQEELAKIYQSAEILVYPSFYEGFGIPHLEAMASGCPVATSNIPAIREVCGNAAHYFNPFDEKNIKKAIVDIISNKSLKKSLVKKGLQRIRLFSWKYSAKKLLNIIENSSEQPYGKTVGHHKTKE